MASDSRPKAKKGTNGKGPNVKQMAKAKCRRTKHKAKRGETGHKRHKPNVKGKWQRPNAHAQSTRPSADKQAQKGAPPAHEPWPVCSPGNRTRRDTARRGRTEGAGEPHSQGNPQPNHAREPTMLAEAPKGQGKGRNAGGPHVAQAKGHASVGKQLLTQDHSHFGSSRLGA